MLSLLFAAAVTAAAPPCELHASGARFAGSCGRQLDIARAEAVTTGVWRKDRHPAAVWAGDVTDAEDGKSPVELETYADGSGILRTIYGWYPVTHFQARAKTITFRLDTARQVPPSELDDQIVRRAAAILSSDAVWNRADDRKCPDGAKSWSIYCAMELATREVTGGFSHRRPALEAVRQIVDERTAGRPYHHRLMDYNNDPSTHLEDVRTLFADALARMAR